ncbi:MAG: ATP-dependent sacrificial sulfur transferase LarE [Candidatus Bathyarchaeota archaeon]|nr:ATP-dependent sacrificial sulfur transferase LarE [Candidatus Bathyarchaeota archaeon]
MKLENKNNKLERKIEKVQENLKKHRSILVALSGGVDSTLVAFLAKKAVGNKAIAVTADSMTLPLGELEESKKIAKKIGIKHLTIKIDETSNLDFTRNPPERCYYCKKELVSKLKEIAMKHHLEVIIDGTNADDVKTHRPGALALAEEKVISPLADAGLTKTEIRTIARMFDLPTAEKPSMACLSSRFPYGQEITENKINRVAEAEKFIRKLIGPKILRVRDHGSMARIEFGRNERKLLFDEKILDSINEKLKSLGFHYVTMDLLGYRSGSMDEVLSRKIVPSVSKIKSKNIRNFH